MRYANTIQCIVSILGVSALGPQSLSQTPAPNKPVVIAASTVLDGKGGVLHNTRIVIEGSKIVRVDSKAGPVDYDLRDQIGSIAPRLQADIIALDGSVERHHGCSARRIRDEGRHCLQERRA